MESNSLSSAFAPVFVPLANSSTKSPDNPATIKKETSLEENKQLAQPAKKENWIQTLINSTRTNEHPELLDHYCKLADGKWQTVHDLLPQMLRVCDPSRSLDVVEMFVYDECAHLCAKRSILVCFDRDFGEAFNLLLDNYPDAWLWFPKVLEAFFNKAVRKNRTSIVRSIISRLCRLHSMPPLSMSSVKQSIVDASCDIVSEEMIRHVQTFFMKAKAEDKFTGSE